MKKVAKKEAKKDAIKTAKVEESPIHNTRGGEMPDPASRNRPLRKDVRFAFRK